jgi:uncharacterized protein (DUF4213/DUF364 family)
MLLEEKLISRISKSNFAVKNVWVGLYWTAVESAFVGMSHTYKTDQKTFIKDAGNFSSLSAIQVAERIYSWDPLEASLGVAALNSLIEPKGKEASINDYIRDHAAGKTVTIVGRFPFNQEIASIAKTTYQLEIEPVGDELPMTACEEVVPQSDINVITATSLINHTLKRLLELGKNGTNIVLGPSTPMSPLLFEFGADILAGIKVVDKVALARCITQGVKKFKLLDGTRPICLFKQDCI